MNFDRIIEMCIRDRYGIGAVRIKAGCSGVLPDIRLYAADNSAVSVMQPRVRRTTI